MKKLLPPAYQDRGGLTRLHPLWLEPPTIRGLASEHLSAPAPWLHIYEGQLPVPSAATCSPTLPGHGGGSGQLSGAHFSPPSPPPRPVLAPAPLPPPPPRWPGPFTGRVSRQLGEGAAQTTRGDVMETSTFPEKYSVWPPSCIEELSGA